jgi:hypothetical protein
VILITLVLGLVTACSPLPVRTPEPTPVWFRVFAPPVWKPWLPILGNCAPAGSASAYLSSPTDADVVLAWGVKIPPNMRAYQIGEETLVPVISAQNTVPSISVDGLRLSYAGQIRDWDFLGQAPGPLTVWAYPADDPISLIMRDSGLTIDPVVRIAPSPAELRSAVAADPTAIGMLPRIWLDASVRELNIPGLDLGQFRAPLLALTLTEPQGVVRAWLACVQEHLKE